MRPLVAGLGILGRILATTLGPAGRPALIERDIRTKAPELIDHGATLARRIVEVRPPFVNTGVMLGRHVAWRTYETCGDGSAGAVVIAASLARHLSRGSMDHHEMPALVDAVRAALTIVQATLSRDARPVRSSEEGARVIRTLVMHAELEAAIAQVMDTLGPDASVFVADDPGASIHVEYTDGARWRKGLCSPAFLGQFEHRVTQQDTYVIASDAKVDDPMDLMPALELAAASTSRSMLLVCSEMSDAATGAMVTNVQNGILRSAIAVRVPSFGPHQAESVADVAALTGGRPILAKHGDRLRDVTSTHLGRARRAWATTDGFGLAGGAGEPAAIDARLRRVRAELGDPRLEPSMRGPLEERAGTLAGAAATLWIGAATTAERENLKLRAEAGFRAARAAFTDGIVDGGGLALVHAVDDLGPGFTIAEKRARNALLAALSAPARAIARNAGLRPEPLLEAARRQPVGATFDVMAGRWQTDDAGIFDPLDVVRTALESAVSGALMAISAGAIVRRKQPLVSAKP